MKVRFAEDVLTQPDAWSYLDAIVQHFIDERHQWAIDDPAIIESSAWIQSEPSSRTTTRNLELMQKLYTRLAYAPENRKMHQIGITVTLRPLDEDSHLAPAAALRALGQPALVFVENATSDGAFLKAMIHAYKRTTLIEARTRGWWTIDSMGGYGEVEKALMRRKEDFVGPTRFLVLADSDRPVPGAPTPTVQKVTEACRNLDVPCYVLTKRKIENYLPVNVLPRGARLSAFLRLSQEQRDHYEMKQGFSKDKFGKTVVPEAQARLFANVPIGVLRALEGGFGKKIGELFHTRMSDFDENSVRLTCAGDPHEIEELLDGIESLL